MSAPEVAAETEANELLTFQPGEAEVGQRLDAFLAARISGWSRSRLQRLIEGGDVLVRGRSSKPSHRLKAGDTIEVELTASPDGAFPPENIPLEIVFEDTDLVVVNKPAGLVVHPGAGVESGTLANALAFHFAELAALSERNSTIRPGIVHRLDKNTSGLLVVAKNEPAHEALSEQFSSRSVFKSYLALVHGMMPRDEDQITEPIARDPKHRTRMGVVAGGRSAHTRYRVKQNFERFALLDVTIKTGRTHQIRVHLAWTKHPVVGDELYGSGRDRTIVDITVRKRVAELGRLFLHAEQLAFDHPRTGERLRFQVPLPTALSDFLETLS